MRKEAELPAAKQDTYIIFGEAKIEDMSAQAQSGASPTPPVASRRLVPSHAPYVRHAILKAGGGRVCG